MGRKEDVEVKIVQDYMDFNWVGKDDPLILSAYIQKQEVTSDREVSTKFYYTICYDTQGENEQTLKWIASPLYDEFDHCVQDMNSRIMPFFVRGRKIGE